MGAETTHYLLEKPRITQHLTGERNYHVFYMLCKAEPSIREPVHIGEWKDYAICFQKGTVETVTTWDDDAEFRDMHAALVDSIAKMKEMPPGCFEVEPKPRGFGPR